MVSDETILQLLNRMKRIEHDLERTKTVEGGFAGSGYVPTAGADIAITLAAPMVTIARAGNKVLLFDSGGALLQEFAATEAGVNGAILAATAGDEIIGPFPIPIAMTAGITIPLSVRIRDLNLAFTCGGSAVSVNNYVELFHCNIVTNGAGNATSIALDAYVGGAGVRDVRVYNSNLSANNATTNIGAWFKGVALNHGPYGLASTFGAENGTNNYGIILDDDCFIQSCFGGANAGANINYGIVFDGSQSGFRSPKAIGCWGLATTASSYGGGLSGNANRYGRATQCHFMGDTGGFIVSATNTLYACDNFWSTITINGTLTYERGDRGAFSVEDYHGTDIEAGALTRHNPLGVNVGDVPTWDGAQWLPAPGGGGGTFMWFNVRDYGAVGDGVTDDTAAVAATLVAIVAAGGGVLYFPYGAYYTTGNFSLDVPITVMGDGCSAYFDEDVNNISISKILCDHDTNSLFTVNSWGCNFMNFLARCVHAAPTGGAGIYVPAYGDLIQYKNLNIQSFSTCIFINDGAVWNMDSVYFYEPLYYGLYFNHSDFSGDFGDIKISNTRIFCGDRDGFAAIYIAAGGNIQLNNITIGGWYISPPAGHAFDYGIQVAVPNNVSTSILLFSNISIENVGIDAIHMTTHANPPSSWNYLLFNNIEFGMYGATGRAININATRSGDIDYVVMTNLITFTNAATANEAIYLTNVRYASLTNIRNFNFASVLGQTGCTDCVYYDILWTLGTGTSNYLTKWTGTHTVGNSLLRDDGTTISLGAAPSATEFFLLQGVADIMQLRVVGFTTQAAPVVNFTRNDGNTNAVGTVMTVSANSTGAVANGFGVGVTFTLESDTTVDQIAADINVLWTDKTHATRTSNIVFDLVSSASTVEIGRWIPGGLTIGSGVAGLDYALTFNGETNDGLITWMEDENWFAITGGMVINETGLDVDTRLEGNTLSYMLFLDASAATENIALLTNSAPNWQTMDGGIYLGDASNVPTGNPANGVFIYSEAGAAKCRGGGGTITTFGPSDPHCPVCGSDYMLEWENEKYGYLAVCMKCMSQAIGDKPWILHQKIKYNKSMI